MICLPSHKDVSPDYQPIIIRSISRGLVPGEGRRSEERWWVIQPASGFPHSAHTATPHSSVRLPDEPARIKGRTNSLAVHPHTLHDEGAPEQDHP